MNTFGGIGKLEIAPFGAWIDLTAAGLVRAEDNPIQITRGRQSEMDSVQPSQLTAVLDNSDGRFTPGYTGGPYGAGFTAGCPVRYSETIGERTFVLFTGVLQYPDVPSWQPIGYQQVQLSATDELAALSRTSPFVSTLGAHILFNGRSTMKAYYPMNDQSAPFLDVLGYGPPMTAKLQPSNPSGSAYTGVTGTAGWAPASTVMAVGDDIPVVTITMQTATFGGSIVDAADVALKIDFEAAGKSIPIVSGQTLTIVAWFNMDVTALCTTIAEVVRTFINSAVGVNFDIIELDVDASGVTNSGYWTAHHAGGPDFIGAKAVSAHWVPVAIRYSWSPQTFEFWFADQPAQSGSWAGSPPGTLSVAQMQVTQEAYAGALAHLQIYVGDPTAYTHTMFLAQMQMGLTGLEFQTTGQRVATILDYAGVPAGLRVVDAGQSFMSVAKLSGQTVAQALQDAIDTERARAFIDGQGRYVFQDRAHTLNV